MDGEICEVARRTIDVLGAENSSYRTLLSHELETDRLLFIPSTWW